MDTFKMCRGGRLNRTKIFFANLTDSKFLNHTSHQCLDRRLSFLMQTPQPGTQQTTFSFLDVQLRSMNSAHPYLCSVCCIYLWKGIHTFTYSKSQLIEPAPVVCKVAPLEFKQHCSQLDEATTQIIEAGSYTFEAASYILEDL